ncbi:hypothetical protein [Tenuibacillus multivorans]|uniref:Uncharacterized protein n=1 Tax=Tenuibacillus multivorans TaxID=237069 RepID=A0A1G9ZDR7_9BACI|nr:hypothetical protein [Tenuibacillus multivorans]GEL78318.1 hypothetical protein TMU01_25530 [Tenuibacillus multivorans]SDN19325.1 hypothetical protein SAMN05216498_1650 [Tenuibacillus multivorans]
MGFFDAIFSNFFVLLAIIAAISGLFKRGSDQEGENHRPTPQRRPQQSETRPKTVSVEPASTISKAEDIEIDAANEWYEQLEETKKRRQESHTNQNLDTIKRQSLYKKDRAVAGLEIKKNLKDKRLVESLVMSEVLGKPKAKTNRIR